MPRLRFVLAVLFCLVAATAPATSQFIHDLTIRPGPGIPHPPIRPRYAPIAIDRHAVTVKIDDGVATTTVKQTFRNPNQIILEGTYLFALPEDAAITAFALQMGGKMVPGEVLEKEKAAAIYRDIVSRAQDPALLEYVGRRLFQAKVFPIPALGTTDVELAYSETLPRSGAILEYRYPFRTEGPSPYPINQASLLIEATTKVPFRAIYSPSHPVDIVRKGDFEAKVSFEQRPCTADRDIVVTFGLGTDPVGATLLSHVEQGNDGAFVLLLSPSVESKATEAVTKDVVFVADTSGSMAGEKIEQLRRALSFCLRSLNRGDRFNVITFSTEARPWSEKLRDVNSESIDQGLQFVKDIKALGGTNISDALSLGVSMSTDRSRPFQLIFLTDGLPTVGTTDVESILKSVRDKNTTLTRLFVFGIGHDVNTLLLDRLAEENHGTRDYVDDREDIELKVSAFYEKVANPVLSDVKVTVEGVKIDETYPKVLPDLFRGSQLLIAGRFQGEGEAKVKLSGQINGKPVEYSYALKMGGSNRRPEIPRLWAVRKVGYLLDQIRLNGQQKELKDEIVRLGVKYGIVTPYTSFLVVEDQPLAVQPRRAGGGERRRDGAVPPGGQVGPGGGGGAGEGTVDAYRNLDETFGTPAQSPAPTADAALRELAAERKPAAQPEASKNEEEARDKNLRMSSGGIGLSNTPGKSKAKADAQNELKRGYFTDAVSLSRQLRELRDSEGGGSVPANAIIKRVGNRTFYQRFGLYVESGILALDPAEVQKKLIKIEQFSFAYFNLIERKPELAAVLAMGNDILFVEGDAIYQIVPKVEAPESR